MLVCCPMAEALRRRKLLVVRRLHSSSTPQDAARLSSQQNGPKAACGGVKSASATASSCAARCSTTLQLPGSCHLGGEYSKQRRRAWRASDWAFQASASKMYDAAPTLKKDPTNFTATSARESDGRSHQSALPRLSIISLVHLTLTGARKDDIHSHTLFRRIVSLLCRARRELSNNLVRAIPLIL